MNTTEFANTLLIGIKKFLTWIGVPHHILDTLDEIIFLVIIVVIAFILASVTHAIFAHVTKRILKRKNINFLSSLAKYDVLRNGYYTSARYLCSIAFCFQCQFQMVHD